MYFYLSILLTIMLFINSQYYLSTKNAIMMNYNKYKQLRTLKKQMNIQISWKLILNIIYFIFNATWALIVQKFLNNVEQLGKNKYSVTFIIGGKIYKIMVKHTLEPSPILQIYDKESNDITDQVEPYLLYQPQSVSPADIDLDEITILYSSGEDKLIGKNEQFTIS